MSEKTTFDVKCPHCGTEWALDHEESQKPEFICGQCNAVFGVQQAKVSEAMESKPADASTRLCDIVVIGIRLLAISLSLDSFNFFLAVLARFRTSRSSVGDFIALGIFAVCAYWLWRLAPWIARRVTHGHDSSFDCGNLALGDLYSFAFLFLGLYFAVDSFGPSLTWLHYSLRQSSSDGTLSPQQQGNFYALFKYLVKLILGLALIFNGRKFATRIIKYQNEPGARRSVTSTKDGNQGNWS